VHAEGWDLFGFVLGGDQTVGFITLAGVQGFLLLGDDVFAVIGASGPAEDAVTILHVSIHVMSMNRLELNALASSGRVKRG